MIALIIGATGATGKDLVQFLLNDNDFEKVIVFVRKPLNFQHEKLISHIVNFDNPEDWKEFVKGDVAYSCLGTTLKDAGSKPAQRKVDFDYQYQFAKMAKQNLVENYVLVSSYGANGQSNVFYSRIKGALEDAVKLLKFDKTTIFRPGMLDRTDSKRTAEVLGLKVLKLINRVGLLKNQKPLPTSILAKAMIKASKDPSNGYKIIQLSEIFQKAE
ncbi:NAD(P)H-binding protein [Chryseobacterium sp.]|uniref:NAD(P)H-binding protein n=1 Tax=Chryseobacterium sp. TaxID=1871047 RepID=UPI00388E04AE